MTEVNFIAEVSSNHNCDLDRCLQFVEESSNAGCTSVKFQLFEVDQLFAPQILLNSKMHRDRKAWELPLNFIRPIFDQCKECGIDFGCTPFYLKAVDELEPYVTFFKIASYELLWDDLIKQCASTGKPLVISTGMATLDEVSRAVEVAKSSGASDLTLLHCVSSYPTRVEETNLARIETLRDALDCKVGWSDHSVNPAVLYRAIHHWGAECIEFHLDLDAEGAEFGSGHCWMPSDIKEVISNVRFGFECDGSPIKEPVDSEVQERLWRADPADGLRPHIELRDSFEGS